MNDSYVKINYLKWLNIIGIKYYFIDKLKDKFMALPVSNNEDLKLKKLYPIKNQLIKDKSSTDIVESDDDTRSNQTSHMNTIQVTDDKVPNIRSYNYSPVIQARKLADKASNLIELKKCVINFDGCDLKKFATNVVFGDGKEDSDIMLIGEAPGVTEDKMGIPFCGESGMLLDNLLKSVDISRNKNAYITNTVFWRPPANRPPTQEEVDICRPFVEKHIALINPKILILVGSTAVTSLLGKNSGISKIRQEYYTYSNKYLSKPINITSIFHPAYLLRQPAQKKVTWFDLIKIKQYIDSKL